MVDQKKFYRQPKIFQSPAEIKPAIWPKILTIALVILILFLVVIYWLFFSNFFVIKNIEVVGTPTIEIKSRLDVLKGKNIFSFNTQEIESAFLAENRNLVNAKIYRGLPDTIKIKFEDREPKLVWGANNNFYLVDNKAIAFKQIENDQKMADLPIILDMNDLTVTIPSQIASSQFIEFIRTAQAEFGSQNIAIDHFEIKETTFQVTAITDKKIAIILNCLRPFSDQQEAFEKVWGKYEKEIKQYIDLRVEGKVYFK